MGESGFLRTGEVAEALGVPEWKVGRLFERKLLPEPPRFGRYRLISREALPAIEAALKKAGYLK